MFAPVQIAADISSLHPVNYRLLYENAMVEFQDTKAKLQKATEIIEQQAAQIEALKVEILQLKKMLFNSRQERFIAAKPSAEQPVLFDVEAIAEKEIETKTLPERKVQREKIVGKHRGRNAFPENLRREVTVIEPQDVDTSNATKIGEDITEILAYNPGEIYVKKTCRPRYADAASGKIVQAPAPARAIEKCSADTSLLAQIAVEKYVDHLPLHRQIKRYRRLGGVEISESTMGDYVYQTGHALTGLHHCLQNQVISAPYLHVDETTIAVLSHEKKGATHQGYYWVYHSHHDKLIWFDYQPGRGREGPAGILKDFKGYLQTDGYRVYDSFKQYPHITVFYCMAHARRKFHEALSNDKERAGYALEQMQQLYAIEREAIKEGISGSVLTQYRQQHAEPVLQHLGKWMKQQYIHVLPKSAIGNALGYSITRWQGLSLYATNGLLHIDNNPVENSIRPVALGRKNYLFAGSHQAAQRAAIFYSMFATCKAHDINPYDWLKDVLDKLAYWKTANLHELLPHNWAALNQ